jgi:hypothetical protein
MICFTFLILAAKLRTGKYYRDENGLASISISKDSFTTIEQHLALPAAFMGHMPTILMLAFRYSEEAVDKHFRKGNGNWPPKRIDC